MPTTNRNQFSREAYLDGITHPRRRELAEMLLDGKSVEEMNAAGYARLNILEAASAISSNVEGQEEFTIDIPRGTGGDSTSAADIERDTATVAEEKKASPADSSAPATKATDTAHVQAQPAGSTDAPNPEHTAPDGKEVPGVEAGEPTRHPVETVGGNPVGTLTGEEDGATIQKKADEEEKIKESNP